MKPLHLYAMKKGRTLLLTAALLILTVALLSGYLATLEAETARRQVAQLEESIVRACVTCFAVEGRYPPSLSYVEENYGVIVDGARCTVYFSFFADNVMPTVRVYAKEGV